MIETMNVREALSASIYGTVYSIPLAIPPSFGDHVVFAVIIRPSAKCIHLWLGTHQTCACACEPKTQNVYLFTPSSTSTTAYPCHDIMPPQPQVIKAKKQPKRQLCYPSDINHNPNLALLLPSSAVSSISLVTISLNSPGLSKYK